MIMKFAHPVRLAKATGRHVLSWLRTPRAAYLIGEPLFWLLGMRRNRQKIDLLQVKRVLVVRLDEIGDVVMTTPFMRELRWNLPDAWITLVVKPAVYNLMELCPYVNEVLTYDWNTPGRFAKIRRDGRAMRLSLRHLWRRRFDLAILPRWDADHYHATFVAYFSGAPRRVGYSENVIQQKQQLNSNFDNLFTHVLDGNGLKHEVERNLNVIRFIGGVVREERLELWVERRDDAFAESVFKEYGVRHRELVVGFGPSGGHSPLKQWPVSRFIELGRWLQEKYDSRILVVGSPGEEMLGREIKHALGRSAVNVVGQTTLRQTAALLKRCHLYVGNDAGPMHIAAAMGIPVVALFGSSCHHRFGAWGHGHVIVWVALQCGPCFQSGHRDRCSQCFFNRPHCMLGITVDQVKEAVETVLSRQADTVALAQRSKHAS